VILLTYRVLSHEYVDAQTTRVVMRCIGWPSEGRRPDETTKSLAYLVPASDVSDFPLGSLLRLTFGGGGAK
jgi:hypothetical protein